MSADVEDPEDRFKPSVTRGKWDPYPWVQHVDADSPAAAAGLRPGDCLLEVNGEDLLGRRVSEMAELVRAHPGELALLVWNAGVDAHCSPEAICCGPMPTNLQRLSACMSTILAFLECPVCLDTIPPPAYQCENGHLICVRCRAKSERCPVCRVRYSRGRSLIGDQIYNALVNSFGLKEDSEDTRREKMKKIFKTKRNNKDIPEIKITPSHTNKFLARLTGKSSSEDNLAKPDHLGDFNLTKSLSTQEIFSGSLTKLSRGGFLGEKRPASCHGSFESLQKPDQLVFHCPFVPHCAVLIKNQDVFEHFKLAHDGPLVQYFKPHVKISYAKIQEMQNLVYLLRVREDMVILRVELDNEGDSDNVLLWSWLLDSGKAAKEFQMQIKVLVGPEENVVISVNNSVFSLNCTAYNEIKEQKKGVFVNVKSLNIASFSRNDVAFDVEILRSDYM